MSRASEPNPTCGVAFGDKRRRILPDSASIVGLTLAAGLLSAPTQGVGQTLTTTTGTTRLTGVRVYSAINNGSAATIVNNGATTGELSNAGVYTNNRVQTGDVARNTGTINNSAGAVWNGKVKAGANVAGGAIVNRGQWIGDIANAGGGVDNRNIVTGDVVNASGVFRNSTAASVVSGRVTNNGATTNVGVIRGGLINNAGTTTNRGVIDGGVAILGGTLTTTGAVAGGLINGPGGTVNAAGSIAGGVVNAGAFTVTGALVNSGGSFDNRGTAMLRLSGGDYTGVDRLTNSSTAAAGVRVDARRTLSAQTIENAAGATFLNFGTVATVAGFANSGTYRQTGATAALTGGLVNTAGGAVIAAGAMAGGVVNAGAFTVMGNLVNSGAAFDNRVAGTLRLGDGDYTGISLLTNRSTAALGVRVDPRRTLSATAVRNEAGATFNSSGTVRANTVENAAGATLINSGALATVSGLVNAGTYRQNGATATLTGGLVSAADGVVVASGSMAGGVANAGAFTVMGNLVNSGGAFDNTGNGTLRLADGDYTGIGALTNRSTSELGLRVDTGRTLSAQTIENAAGSTLINSGTLATGAGFVNAGVYRQTDAAATLTGGLVNAAGGTVIATGSLAGGLVNAGVFTVAGPLAGDGVSIFENRAGALLDVARDFTDLGRIVNAGTVAIGPGARLALRDAYLNAATGATTNAGTLAATGGTVNLSTQFANAGQIEGGVTNGDGAIAARFDNIGGEKGAGARILGTVTNRSLSVFDNTGVIEGDFVNEAGATLNAANTITGRIDNAGEINLRGTLDPTIVDNRNRLNLAEHRLEAAQVNNHAAGVVTATNGEIAGNFANAGVIDLTGGPNPAQNTLSVTGDYAGGGALRIAADLSSTATAHSGALLLGGAGSGNTAVSVSHGPVGYFAAPVQVVRDGGGSTYTLATGLGGGLLSVSLRQLSPGQWYLTSNLDTRPLSAVAGAVGSAIASAATGFFQNPASLVGAAPDARPNQFSLSLWTQAAAGRNDIASGAATTTGGGVAYQTQKTRALYEGYQVGSDLALSNIENTHVDAHLGVTAGQYFSHAYELLGSATTSAFNMPFVGVYGVLAGRGFYVDAMARHDFWNVNLTNAAARLDNTRVGGDGWGGSVSAGYRHELGAGWYLEPSAAMHVASASFGDVPVAAGDVPAALRLGDIRSVLGRAGLRMGASCVAGALALRPFATADVWREFEGDMQESFRQSDSRVPISVSRIGTFAQLGLGVSARLVDTGWGGFLSGDYRTGERLTGGAVKGGLRYIF
ncbi:hypothetical protein [Methylocystis echinoides]|uniref:Autotransporter domain-containing protein n=1 Tax=Methylocystis echinoides TaxID=29468 RepID=A0A9W6GQK1_9HYPH|nr:hypothetical protein [Methylocystis echinoides]GLI91181.1 hypothetical protein LMG27198_01730 [Methylocystis echinoides]